MGSEVLIALQVANGILDLINRFGVTDSNLLALRAQAKAEGRDIGQEDIDRLLVGLDEAQQRLKTRLGV